MEKRNRADIEIETERLIIREFEKRDIGPLTKNMNNLHVSKNLLAVPYPYKKKDAAWWINHCAKLKKERPQKTFEFAIELKAEKNLIGGISLMKYDPFQGTAEVGCWLGEKYWRQGYMFETASSLINYGFKKLKLRKFRWGAFADNVASNELAKKLGFVLEGVMRKGLRCKATKKIHDETRYGLLREEWKNGKK